MLATDRFVLQKVEIFNFFLKNQGAISKNHCTNTGLVYTHLSAFFMLNPNMVMKI